MSDLINRQDAIDVIEAKKANEYGDYMVYNVAFNDGLRSAVSAIEELPSAQKKGEWIKIDKYDKESNVQCSVCLEEFDYIDGVCYLCHGYELPLFCPNCGADMQGDEG